MGSMPHSAGSPCSAPSIAPSSPEARASGPAPAPWRAGSFGFYVSGDYQLNRRWFPGGRFDRSQRGSCASGATSPCGFPGTVLQDTGGSLLLTYWPSEFSQIRGQLRRTRYGEGLTANELLFQFMFSMGPMERTRSKAFETGMAQTAPQT